MKTTNHIITVLFATILSLLFFAWPAMAGSATWLSFGANSDWHNSNNWTPGGPPNGAMDTATFRDSSQTSISLENVEVNTIVFQAAGDSFNFILSPQGHLTLSGMGITNNSGTFQRFFGEVNAAGFFSRISFTNMATAGNGTSFINDGGTDGGSGAITQFFDSSGAGSGTFTNHGGGLGASTEFNDSSSADSGTFSNRATFNTTSAAGSTKFNDNSGAGSGIFTNQATNDAAQAGGFTEFNDSSSAEDGTFTNEGGTGGFAAGGVTRFNDSSSVGSGTFTNHGGTAASAAGGSTLFNDDSSAGSGTFTNNGGTVSGAGGSATAFNGNASADSATLIANGGVGVGGRINFFGNSTGGTARVQVFGNGLMDISGHTAPGVTVGSIEGDGNVFLGARQLSVGTNNTSTSFSGVLRNGGLAGGVGGSLAKIGSGTLTLSGANTYTGSTTVNAGTLLVNGSITSAVTVNGGTLGGSGSTGAVTVNNGGTLAPGNSPGILNVQGDLALMMGSTYLIELNGTAVGTQYDQTNVTGLVSLDDATLSLSLGFTPVLGTMFTIINNDLSDVIMGMFDGLPDGATFTADGQLFSITYRGGDGNEVVVTTVPEPATWAVMCAGVVALIVFRSRKRR